MGILAEKLERCRKAVILKDTVESVEALVREIGSELMDFALRRCKPEIAKEICQETLLVIALKYREFRGSEDRQFRSWCYTILRRKLSNYFRDEKPALFEPLSESEQWEVIAARDKEITPGVPRAVLRFIAQNSTGGLIRVMLAYVLRGMSIKAQGGEIASKGRVKASWIAQNFGLSERSVKYAQRKLREFGWIDKDRQSHQCVLNRHGA